MVKTAPRGPGRNSRSCGVEKPYVCFQCLRATVTKPCPCVARALGKQVHWGGSPDTHTASRLPAFVPGQDLWARAGTDTFLPRAASASQKCFPEPPARPRLTSPVPLWPRMPWIVEVTDQDKHRPLHLLCKAVLPTKPDPGSLQKSLSWLQVTCQRGRHGAGASSQHGSRTWMGQAGGYLGTCAPAERSPFVHSSGVDMCVP